MLSNVWSLKGLLAVGAVVLAMAWSVSSASAGLLFSDSFDGMDGTALTTYDSDYVVTNNAGGIAGRKAEIDSPGLSIPWRNSAGNSLYLAVPDSGSPSLNYEFTNDNDLVNQNPGDSNVYYASAMFKLDTFGTDSFAAIAVVLPFYKESNALERDIRFGLYRRAPVYGSTLHVAAAYESNWAGGTLLADYVVGTTVQVVLKTTVTSSAGADTLKFYAAVNPQLSVEPTWAYVGATESATGGWNLDAVRVVCTAPNNASAGWIDEIRIGTAYSDVVVPEPATMGLLGLGLVGLVARRRK